MKTKLLILLFALAATGCRTGSETERYQKRRDAVTDVRARIREVDFGGDLLVGANAALSVMGEYLLILDHNSYDKLLHVVDKNDFRHLYSGINKGRGPGEIVIPGNLTTDPAQQRFYIPDFGKLQLYGYTLGEFLENPDYRPDIQLEMNSKQFPSASHCIGGDELVGLLIQPVGTSDFKQSVAKWNMTTGEIVPMPFEHPQIERRRIGLAVSAQHGLYAEIYHHHDLMTICDLEGNLKCNIYGPGWDATSSNKVYYYGKALFCGDKIIASYSGKDYDSEAYEPTQLLVFSLDGEYLRTLETGYRLKDFCYDAANGRLILSLNDEIQFAVLDLDGILQNL